MTILHFNKTVSAPTHYAPTQSISTNAVQNFQLPFPPATAPTVHIWTLLITTFRVSYSSVNKRCTLSRLTAIELWLIQLASIYCYLVSDISATSERTKTHVAMKKVWPRCWCSVVDDNDWQPIVNTARPQLSPQSETPPVVVVTSWLLPTSTNSTRVTSCHSSISFWETYYRVQGLCPRTPLGEFRPPDLIYWTHQLAKPAYARTSAPTWRVNHH